MARVHVLCLPGIRFIMKHLQTRSTREALAFCAPCLLFLLVIGFSAQVRQGVSDALTVCATVIVPSLFPLLILSSFASSCPCPAWLQRAMSVPLRVLFGLSPGCAVPLLLGIAGGYPLAAETAVGAFRKGSVTEEDTRRLTLFFTCPGIPFTVAAAGEGYFLSRSIGWTLFASCALADLLMAAGYNLFSAGPAESILQPQTSENVPLSARFVGSVDHAIRAMASVCAWIAAFYAFNNLLAVVCGEKAWQVVSLFAEITSAVAAAQEQHNVPLAAFCLAFGGLCIFCQLLPDILSRGVGAVRFLVIRLLGGVLAFLIETALLRLLSIPVPTQTRLGPLYLSADSAAGSAALLFLCAVFMAEIARPGAAHSIRKRTRG